VANDLCYALCSKDVRLPVQLQRAMAAEAEAAREARAKVIAAEGEQKASHALREAAEIISESPGALQVCIDCVMFNEETDL
jgi:erythrocyte band 7 integral membrane protein